MLTYTQRPVLTTVSGTASVNITAGINVCLQILIKATTSSTTFDISLTDVWDNIIYEKTNITGKTNQINVNLPSNGNWTLTIANASADEAFSTLFHFLEKY